MRISLRQLDLSEVADLIRKRIEERIGSPGKWNRTGHLLRSLRTQTDKNGTAGLTIANDRLQRDEIALRFYEEIVPHDIDDATRQAIEAAFHEAVSIERDK